MRMVSGTSTYPGDVQQPQENAIQPLPFLSSSPQLPSLWQPHKGFNIYLDPMQAGHEPALRRRLGTGRKKQLAEHAHLPRVLPSLLLASQVRWLHQHLRLSSSSFQEWLNLSNHPPLPSLPAPSPCRRTGAQGGAEATGGSFVPMGAHSQGFTNKGELCPERKGSETESNCIPQPLSSRSVLPLCTHNLYFRSCPKNLQTEQSLLVALLYPGMSCFRTQCWQLHPVSTQHLKRFHSPFAGAQFHLGLAPSPFCSGVFVDVPVPFLHGCSSSGEFIPDPSH